MTSSFEFATAGRIVAGPGRAQELPGMLAWFGSRVLVVTGADPARHRSLLAGLGLAAAVFPVAAEPTVELARAAVAAARQHGADVIAAIGGGSVIDTGKAVAMLLGNGGDPLDYLEVVGSGRAITRPAAPCVAVPTTAGTGAEVTANAVLAVPSHQVKASLRSPLMIPRVALVDPLLTVSCPPSVTAASGLDALTQCLEPFVSVQATPLTDGLAREGLRRARHGPADRLRRRLRCRGAGRHGHVQPARRDGAGQRQARRRPRPRRRHRRHRGRAARDSVRRAAGPGHRGERAGAAVRGVQEPGRLPSPPWAGTPRRPSC